MTTLETRVESETFASLLGEVERADGAHPLRDRRRAAFDRFAVRGLPTTRDEAWKYTSLAPLARVPFTRPMNGQVTRDTLRGLTFGETGFIELVFVDGRYAPMLSSVGDLPAGAYVGSLASCPASLAPFIRGAQIEGGAAFDALNLALTEDGALVHVPRDTRLSAPVHLVFVTTRHDGPVATHPRNLVVAEAGSVIEVIESYVTDGGQVYFTNAVTDIRVGESARVDHYKLQREGTEAFHVADLRVRTEAHATFRSFFVSTGGRLVRNEIHAPMGAENVTCRTFGLMLLDGEQHCDAHLAIDHDRPHCTSEQVYKGIFDGRSHGVFSGRVHVAVNAQKTDAQQSCKNLLLSRDAVVTARPQLEIDNDDVKASHGVAIGSLDETQFFYLRARGIGPSEARDILTYAFASELLTRFDVDAVRADVERRISSGLATESKTLREEAEA